MNRYETNNIKNAAINIFSKETFDEFQLIEADFAMLFSTHIDGRINKEFLNRDNKEETNPIEASEYVSYKHVRPHLYDTIKGKILPVSFKIVLNIPSDILEDIIGYDENIDKYILIIKYEADKLSFTTGISFSNFSFDKDCEKRYDTYIYHFLVEHDLIDE